MELFCLASDFCHSGNQLLTVPHCLELFWDREFSLEGKNRNLLLKISLLLRLVTTPTASGSSFLSFVLWYLLYHHWCLFCPQEILRTEQLSQTSNNLIYRQPFLLVFFLSRPPNSINYPSTPPCNQHSLQGFIKTQLLHPPAPSRAAEGSRSSTHKVPALGGDQDVHLRGLGTDDLAVEGALAQVHVAPICLVDGNRWHFTHDLAGPEQN